MAGSHGQVPTVGGGGSAREQPLAGSAPSCDRSGQGQAALRDVQPGWLRPEPSTPAPTAAFRLHVHRHLLDGRPLAPSSEPSPRGGREAGWGGLAEQLSATGGWAVNMTLLGRGHACEIKDLKTNWVPDQQGGPHKRHSSRSMWRWRWGRGTRPPARTPGVLGAGQARRAPPSPEPPEGGPPLPSDFWLGEERFLLF